MSNSQKRKWSRDIRQRLRTWWHEPIRIDVHVRRSPDWEADAAKWGQDRKTSERGG